MAPRSAKVKKPVDVADSEIPKKGRGKGKNVVDAEVEETEIEVNDKAPVVEKKAKRGKKNANVDQSQDKTEESTVSVKKGRKKNLPAVEEKAVSNGDQSDDQSTQAEDDQNENVDANGHADETENTAGKGRKKTTKKEAALEKNETKASRGKKNKQEIVDNIDPPKDEVEDKPKPVGKGRGRPKAQAKVESEPEDNVEVVEEEIKDKPPTKGRKRGPAKVKNEKKEEIKEGETKEPVVEPMETVEKPVKKEPKGRKNQGKKQSPKEDEDIPEEKEELSASKRRKIMNKEGKAEPKDEDEDDDLPDIKPAKGRKGQKKAAEAAAETDEEPQDTGEPITKRRRKPADEKAELKDEDEDEDLPDIKPAKGRKGQKKAAEASTETDEEPQDTGDPITKRRRKPADEKAPLEDKKKAPPKNKSTTNYEELDFSSSATNVRGKEWNFKISSWNVDGIRAWWSKGGLDYVKHEKPDILCLQEIKCSKDKLPDEVANLPGYHAYWLAGDKDGYAGVAIYTTKLAMNVQYGLQNEELDAEGRIITAEYEQFYLICTYVPNSGRKLVTLPKRLQWNEEFRRHIKDLDSKKPVIICGDMNVSHNEIDLANPKTNRKNAGFTDEERAGMTELLGDGFIDTFRHLNPEKTAAYTFWTYMSNSRAKNVGWRLDYFIVSERLLSSVCDSIIRSQVYGSDHCPISLFLHLSTADKPKE